MPHSPSVMRDDRAEVLYLLVGVVDWLSRAEAEDSDFLQRHILLVGHTLVPHADFIILLTDTQESKTLHVNGLL